MIMTEDEAQKKECRAINGSDDWTPKCIASNCAHWRWAWTQEHIDEAKAHNARAALTGQEMYRKPPEKPAGYCGLAGKP